MVSTLIFDFDGVLSPDNTEMVLESFKDVISGSSFYSRMIASRYFYDAMMGHISFSDFKQSMAKLSDIDTGSIERIFSMMMDSRRLNPDVVTMLRKAKEEGYRLVLYSDLMKVPFDHWVRKFSLRSLFDHLLCSAYIGSLKNNPESWDKVLRAISTSAEECILIDDRASNVEVAASRKIKGILFYDVVQCMRELERKGVLLG